jgi:hypothetical protein
LDEEQLQALAKALAEMAQEEDELEQQTEHPEGLN